MAENADQSAQPTAKLRAGQIAGEFFASLVPGLLPVLQGEGKFQPKVPTIPQSSPYATSASDLAGIGVVNGPQVVHF